jgi:hypothetical protein
VVGDPENDPSWCRKVKSVEPAGESRWVVIHKPVPLRPAMELVVERVVADQPRRLSLPEDMQGQLRALKRLLER